jgi:hypothetical protein
MAETDVGTVTRAYNDGAAPVPDCSCSVYFSKTGEEGASDYLVDHSIIHYLIDPDGEFVTFYGEQAPWGGRDRVVY